MKCSECGKRLKTDEEKLNGFCKNCENNWD